PARVGRQPSASGGVARHGVSGRLRRRGCQRSRRRGGVAVHGRLLTAAGRRPAAAGARGHGLPDHIRQAREMAEATGAGAAKFSERLRHRERRSMTTDISLERYSRQIRFPGVGDDGQRRLLDSHVTLCGCGALGTVLANALIRGGVGHLRLIDRDFIETSNLQRQVLFDEHDVAENLPKAEAAARKLAAINSSVHVDPVVADIDRTNILELVENADLILDGTDNFEIRYLIKDVAVKLNKPWVYGGCIGSHGQSMTILPGETPCLRCVFEAAPAPGEAGTCETAGVLGPMVNIIASFQATEAFKILIGRKAQINRELIYIDVWDNILRRIKIAPLLGKVDCP